MNATTTYTKVTENITIVSEELHDRINVFTIWTDPDETFCTMPKIFKSQTEAQAYIVNKATRILNAK